MRRSRTPSAARQPAERSIVHGRRDLPDRPCGLLTALLPRSIRVPSPFRAPRDRPCSQSRAASRETSRRNLAVLCAHLYSPLGLLPGYGSRTRPHRNEPNLFQSPCPSGSSSRTSKLLILRALIQRAL